MHLPRASMLPLVIACSLIGAPAGATGYILTDINGFPNVGGGPASINDSAQVCGSMLLAGPTVQWHAFIWQNGVLTDLQTLGGAQSFANGINHLGQVAGYSEGAAFTAHAFIWQNGFMTDIDQTGYSHATAINENGDVAGDAAFTVGITSVDHAALWHNGTLTDLGTLGGSWSNAEALNNVGQVAGYAATASGAKHAFVWQNGVMTDLPPLPGLSDSEAYGINDSGVVVGLSGGYPTIWRGGVASPLAGGTGWVYGINNNGQIAGYGNGFDSTGQSHPVIWNAADGSATDLVAYAGTGAATGISPSGLVCGHGSLNATRPNALLLTPDNSPPLTQASLSGTKGSNNYFLSSVQVTLTATDPDGPSNLGTTYYVVDGGPTQIYSGPFTISTNGINSLAYWSVDIFGNQEPLKSNAVAIDTGPTTITESASPSSLKNSKSYVNVTVSGVISAASGPDIYSASYKVVDSYGQVQPSGTIYMVPGDTYSFVVSLLPRLKGHTPRSYTIIVSASSMAGTKGSSSVVVPVT